MSLVFQIIALLIVAAVLYSVVFDIVAGHRRESSRRAAYNEMQVGLRSRLDAELAKWNAQQRLTDHKWKGYRKFEVRNKTHLGESGICEFELAPRDGQPLPPYQPGQFLTFKVTIGSEKKQAVRCYSLSDRYRKDDNLFRVCIKKLSHPPSMPDAPNGLVSTYFHYEVKVGSILDVRAPAGNFVLDVTEESPVVFIAGGVGITPVWSMLTELAETQPRREAWFFYGVRNKKEHVFYDTIEEMKSKHDNVRFRVCYSDPEASDAKDLDYDHAGRITIDYLKEQLPSNEFEFFICGPGPMMTDLTAALEQWQVPKSNIRTEAFIAPSKGPAPATDGDITVTFAKSNRAVSWNATTGNLLDFAEENDIAMSSGCRAGSCGECIVAVREGEVDYVSDAEADCEENCCLACIAVPKGNLVLDA